MERKRPNEISLPTGSWWHIVVYVLLGCALLVAAYMFEILMSYPGSGAAGY